MVVVSWYHLLTLVLTYTNIPTRKGAKTHRTYQGINLAKKAKRKEGKKPDTNPPPHTSIYNAHPTPSNQTHSGIPTTTFGLPTIRIVFLLCSFKSATT